MGLVQSQFGASTSTDLERMRYEDSYRALACLSTENSNGW